MTGHELHLEDVMWLADDGQNMTRIAARVGHRPRAIEKALRRAGRVDVLRRIASFAPTHDMSRGVDR